MDGYRDAEGAWDQLGIQAFFLPTYGGKNTAVVSQFPALLNPVLNLEPYHGDLRVNAGIPQSVYQLDKSKLKEFKDSKGAQVRENLRIGESMTLPNGAGTITFDGVREWAGFQITQQPGSGWALGGAITAILGLAGSLFIQRRRVWVRAVTGPDGITVVEMAGLGRSESAKVPEELGELAAVVHAEAPTAPEPEPESEPDSEPSAAATATPAAPAPRSPADSAVSVGPDSSTPKPPAVPSEGAEQ